MKTEQYDTLSQAIKALQDQGYTEDFNLLHDSIDCRGRSIRLRPEDFDIDKVFRFFGASDPDDESILYAISSNKYSLKGILVNGYGISSDPLSEEMLRKLD